MKTLPIYIAGLEAGITDPEQLLQSYPDLIDAPNPNGQTPFHFAAGMGNLEGLRLLLQYGSRAMDTPGASNCTPFYFAAGGGHDVILEYLLDHGSQAIDVPDNHGNIPLHYAIESGHASTIRLLLARAPDVMMDDKILDVAIRKALQNSSSFEVLVQTMFAMNLSQRLVNYRGTYGNTMFFITTGIGNIENIKIMLRYGIPGLDVPNLNGQTPLHFAAETGYNDILELLLRYGGASIDLVENSGYTPLALAFRDWRHRGKTISILKAVGATIPDFDVPDNVMIFSLFVLQRPLEEKKIMKIRNRIFFQPSLLSMLLDMC